MDAHSDGEYGLAIAFVTALPWKKPNCVEKNEDARDGIQGARTSNKWGMALRRTWKISVRDASKQETADPSGCGPATVCRLPTPKSLLTSGERSVASIGEAKGN